MIASKIRTDEVYGVEEVIPHSCLCCAKCWLVINSKRKGRIGHCLYGGPYKGYIESHEPAKPAQDYPHA